MAYSIKGVEKHTVGNEDKAPDGVEKRTVTLSLALLTVWKCAPFTVWKCALEFMFLMALLS
jgi:hypothetical protein